MGGIGGLVMAVFGVIWTVGALSMGAPPFFALFGVVFILVAIGRAIYSFYNAGAKDRMSQYDITREGEEHDPIAKALGHEPKSPPTASTAEPKPRRFEGEFCPFCGAKVQDDFDYCPQCGKDV